MRILSHYFVVRFLGLFSTGFVAAFLILATIELVINFDDLSTLGVSSSTAHGLASEGSRIADIARSLWVRIASYYMADVIPIVSFLAVFITFAWAGRAMEILAIQAGGIRLHRVVLPVVMTTLILSCATALLHETLILQAQQSWSNLSGRGSRQPDFGRVAFWYHKGRTITNIASADAETRTLRGVEIFERGPGGAIARVIRVDRVQIGKDGVWHLEDAAVWTFDTQNEAGRPKLEKNVSMALDLDAIGGDVLLHADPGVLPIRALADYLNARPNTTPSRLRQLGSRFHERLSRPWLVFVFGWLALPFALRVDERGRFGLTATGAIVALSLFFLVQSAGTTLAQQELLPVGITPWFAMGIVVLGSTLALRRRGF